MKKLKGGFVFQKGSVQSGASPTEFEPSLVPTNAWHLDRAKSYPKEIAPLMSAKIDRVRDFFLTDIAPSAFAASNGFADANEVLVSSFGDKSSIAPLYSTFEGFLVKVVKAKMVMFLSQEFKLSKEECDLFLNSISENPSDDRFKTLLREMHSVANVPGTDERSSVLMQQLQGVKAHRRGSRVRADRSAPGRDGEGRGSPKEKEPNRASDRLRTIRKSFS